VLITLEECSVRSWRRSDAASLVKHGDDREIWINLRDTFPHPYTLAHAHRFLHMVARQKPEATFAIAVEDEAVGAIGLRLQRDVERCSAEIGYWLGRAHWGRGITTAVLRVVTGFALESFALTRIYAIPFEWNAASIRVLEKAGYVREGRMRRSAIKDGRVVDQLLYAYVP